MIITKVEGVVAVTNSAEALHAFEHVRISDPAVVPPTHHIPPVPTLETCNLPVVPLEDVDVAETHCADGEGAPHVEGSTATASYQLGHQKGPTNTFTVHGHVRLAGEGVQLEADEGPAHEVGGVVVDKQVVGGAR